MLNKIRVVTPLLLLFLTSCSSFDNLFKESQPISKADQDYIDSLMRQPQWEIPNGKTTYPKPRTWNLIHQNVEIRVDLPGARIYGFTELFLVNRQVESDSLVLDAVNIEIEEVRNQKGEGLEFSNDSSRLIIYPGQKIGRSDTLKLAIRYRADSSESLQFINPSGDDNSSDPQVWTRSKLKKVSEWLPTIAESNEKTTADLWISVPESMQTVASGKQIEKKIWPGDSLRTDYWSVTDPVNVHNIGWAAGVFASRVDTYNDKVFSYYSSPEYEASIPVMYQNSKKILAFLESITGITYSSPAYHLVPLQRYPAKGEALSTTSFLFEEAQFDERAAQDVNNKNILLQLFAKQLLDNRLVYNDWAYAGLKEGLSRHFVYMYHQNELNNSEEANHLRKQDYRKYFNQADTLRKPLVFRGYSLPSEFMDAHGLYKSAAFWYMLQQRIGEDAFLSGFQDLLLSDKKTETPNLTKDNIIRVFSEVSGQSLQQFFQQWLEEPGHPDVAVDISERGQQLLVNFEQIQREPQPIFELQPNVEIITENSIRTVSPLIKTADTTFKYELDSRLQDVIVDPNRNLLVDWKQTISKTQALSRVEYKSATVRLNALQELKEFQWNDTVQNVVMSAAANDNFGPVRQAALKLLSRNYDPEIRKFVLERTFENEPYGRARITALHMAARDTVEERHDYLKRITRDTSYFVAAEAIKLYAREYPDRAYPYIKEAGMNSSYRNVLKAGLAQGLRYIDREEARKDLFMMANQTGDDQYIADAMESLSYHIKNYVGSPWKSKIIDLYMNKTESPYPEIRHKAGKLLDNFQSRPDNEASSSSSENSSL